mmetsp:Transcript_21569/g.39124  ORF Transcript_21569/g.39124 Transcript_21569/m.39124 type:complete len:158 (+) Transcript_21569:3045-3518(+)
MAPVLINCVLSRISNGTSREQLLTANKTTTITQALCSARFSLSYESVGAIHQTSANKLNQIITVASDPALRNFPTRCMSSVAASFLARAESRDILLGINTLFFFEESSVRVECRCCLVCAGVDDAAGSDFDKVFIVDVARSKTEQQQNTLLSIPVVL